MMGQNRTTSFASDRKISKVGFSDLSRDRRAGSSSPPRDLWIGKPSACDDEPVQTQKAAPGQGFVVNSVEFWRGFHAYPED
jgi:hypothetical protein